MTTLQIVQEVNLIGYTPLVLFVLGLLGILLHNLIKLNEINKKLEGKASLGKYLSMEIYSIIISILIVIGAVITSQEIKTLHNVGKTLGLAFVTIGYMGQSVLIAFMGRAEKKINNE